MQTSENSVFQFGYSYDILNMRRICDSCNFRCSYDGDKEGPV